MLRVDNGPEFISERLDTWCEDRKITLALGDVTSPTNRGSQQNSFNESVLDNCICDIRMMHRSLVLAKNSNDDFMPCHLAICHR